MTKYYCFYHNDMDGKSAAWCVHLYLKGMKDFTDNPVNYQRHGYSDPWKLSFIGEDTTVFLVDLSFTRDTVKNLYEICKISKKVIWIDHHQSSLDLLAEQPDIQRIPNLSMFISNNGCGALLTFVYLKIYDKVRFPPEGLGNIFEPSFDFNTGKAYIQTKDISSMSFVNFPKWLNLVDDYDRWQGRYPQTNQFILGCDSINTSVALKDDSGKVIFNDEFWNGLFQNSVLDKYIDDGYTIQRYIQSKYKRELVNCFEYTLPNGEIILCKNGSGNSWNFADEIERYPAVCLFSFSGKNGVWQYSVYSSANSDFDCKQFCEQYGGGGHLHAAGFSLPVSIFTPTPA